MLACLIPGFFLAWSGAAAQNLGFDSSRWHEIELIVFANPPQRGETREFKPSRQAPLSYPANLRALKPAFQDFMVDFDLADAADPFLPEDGLIGPQNNPPADAFRVSDFARDSFIALSPPHHRLGAISAILEASPEHRLLYHALWRQPLSGRQPASAVFISGGRTFGLHQELEGSVLASYEGGGIRFAARLWLYALDHNVPAPDLGLLSTEEEWRPPPRPFPLPLAVSVEAEITPLADIADPAALNEPPADAFVEADFAPAAAAESAPPDESPSATFMEAEIAPPAPLRLALLALMNQTRFVASNRLHYLDHPSFGALLEIRPYQLPQDREPGPD